MKLFPMVPGWQTPKDVWGLVGVLCVFGILILVHYTT